MSGQIFISYRRDDSSGWAGRLYDSLNRHFVSNQIFIDVDTLEPGTDFVEAIKSSVGSCDVLITVIGKRWLISSDEDGKRRLDNPDDFVRLEVATALDRKIRVIPVLVDGASMPRSSDLPDDMKLLTRRNALDVSHNRFNADSGRLIAVVERVLEKIETEKKRLVVVLRRREDNLRWEAEQREKQRLEAERQEKERLAAVQREKERVEAERIESERLDTERQEKERLEAESRQRKKEERLKVEQLQRERRETQQRDVERSEDKALQGENEVRKSQQEEAAPPISIPNPSQEAGAASSQPAGPRNASDPSQAKTKWLLPMAVAVALIMGFGAFFLATHKKPTPAILAPTPTPSQAPLSRGTVTIHPDNRCDLLQGIELGNASQGNGDFTFRLSNDIPSLYPSKRSGFVFFKRVQEISFENIALNDVESLDFGNGLVRLPIGPADGIGLLVGEIYAYRLRGVHYGILRIDAVTPSLVVSFVNYK